MHTRENALQLWLNTLQIHPQYELRPLAGDASFRRYFRLKTHDNTQIIMDAPPDKLSLDPFIQIANQLHQHGFHIPKIHAINHQQGFMLLEDFGDQLFLKALSIKNADPLYRQAISVLTDMQQCNTDDLEHFDQAFMLNELTQFSDWFLKKYLDLSLDTAEQQLIKQTMNWLTERLANQPQVFIHRDYHSRNIMLLSNPINTLGIIDFQDAMRGPWTYDLVSLLKDCYVAWPREQVIEWVSYFYQLNQTATTQTFDHFLRDFDLCGLERHLRVLGTFCRLCFRDNKPHYLNDLPLTFRYVMSCLVEYDELKPFYTWMQQRVQPIFNSRLEEKV